MNTSAPLFAENLRAEETEKNLAEAYCRLYALAAEDFTSTADVNAYIKALTEWARLVQESLTSQLSILANHTHRVPEHTHPIEPHTHIDSKGGPTSPNTNALMTQPVPLVTEVPVQSSQIKWTTITPPTYTNTTLTTPNLQANYVITGPTAVGPLTVNLRRAKTPRVLLKPSVLPIIKSMADVR